METNNVNGVFKGVTSNYKEGRDFLFVIGVSKYKDAKTSESQADGWGKLNNARKDAEAICTLLQNNYGFLEKYTYALYDEDVTRENLFECFMQLKKRVLKNDRLLIYYSGHGYLSTDFKNNPIDGAWIPFNAKFDVGDQHFTNADLKKELDNIRAKHILILADACHSGALISGKLKGIKSVSNNKLHSTPSRQAFCSGRMKDQVYDGDKGGHSPFAKAILTVLETAEEYCFLEFIARVREEVNIAYERLRMNIEPTHGQLEIPGNEGGYQGEFIFFPKKRVLTKEDEEWNVAQATNTIAGYKKFLSIYTEGKYTSLAESNIRMIKVHKIKYYTISLLVSIALLVLIFCMYLSHKEKEKIRVYNAKMELVEKEIQSADFSIETVTRYLGEAIKMNPSASDTLKEKMRLLVSYNDLIQEADQQVNKTPQDTVDLKKAAQNYERALRVAFDLGMHRDAIIEKLIICRADINKFLEGAFIDPRDGQRYKTIKIGKDEWMAQNLNYETPQGSYCYENDEAHCTNTGRLYTWEMGKQACPPGWSLPNNKEWRSLGERYGGYYDFPSEKTVGDSKKAYHELRNPDVFAAQLGGYRAKDGGFEYLGRRGRYWSYDEFDDSDAWFYYVTKDKNRYGQDIGDKLNSRSCRCIKNK